MPESHPMGTFVALCAFGAGTTAYLITYSKPWQTRLIATVAAVGLVFVVSARYFR